MEKIRLANNQEFNLVPMGIIEISENKRRCFKFISDLSYDIVKAAFENKGNLESIDYILSDNSTIATYKDCVSLKSLSKEFNYKIDENTTTDIYVAELSTDAVEKTLKTVENNVVYTELALTEVYELLLGVTV